MNKDSNINKKIRKTNLRVLKQDLGLLVFLAGILGACALIAVSSGRERTENLIMYLILCGEIILAAYKFRYIAVVLGGIQTSFFAIYKIYQGLMEGQQIQLYSFAWLFLPMICILSMVWFMNSFSELEVMTEILEKQVEEQITTDRVTGLYNIKSFYMDLERQMAFCRRNNLPLTLMVMELRYEQELRSILSVHQFEELRQIYAEVLEDSIRLEDRLYALDEKGGMGIICTCNKAGAEIMKGRIQNNLAKTDRFRNTLKRSIRVDVRTGIAEYDKEAIANSIELKKRAENELQYDV